MKSAPASALPRPGAASEGAPATKVLLLTPDLSLIGGVENYYNALDLRHHDARVEYFFVNRAMRESAPRAALRLLAGYVSFWRKLGTRRYGLVVLNPSLNVRSYYRDAVFCILARLRCCMTVTFFRGWSDDLEARIRRPSAARALFRASFARMHHFIVLGELFKRKLAQLIGRDDCRFWVETTVADSSFLADFSLASRRETGGPLKILFLSRIVRSKGAALALQAFKLAQTRLAPGSIELIVAGDGPDLEELRAVTSAEGIANVRFPGMVSGAGKKQVLMESQVFLFPTTHGEGLPNAVLEAMLYGMPVLSRRVGGIPEVVEHGTNGFLTDSCDPCVFADWIVELATHQQLRVAMAVANHDKARQLYISDAVRARFSRILDELLAEAAGARA